VNIRRFVLRAHSLAELVRLGTMTGQCARFLEAMVVAGVAIAVSGATGTGKTTLLSFPEPHIIYVPYACCCRPVPAHLHERQSGQADQHRCAELAADLRLRAASPQRSSAGPGPGRSRWPGAGPRLTAADAAPAQ
jgi:hypothetical protein